MTHSPLGRQSSPPRRTLQRSGLFASIVATIVFGTTALAGALVSTDQSDYSPGSVVTISGDNSNFSAGAGYLAGETVDVSVVGPNAWTGACYAVAQSDGTWNCAVTLSADPAIAVGSYTYSAYGESSGTLENGTFTDAANKTDLAASVSPASVYTSASATLKGVLTKSSDGSGFSGQTLTFLPSGNSTCSPGQLGASLGSATTDATGAATLGITAPAIAGTYYYDVAFAGTGSGSSGYSKSDGCTSLTVTTAPPAPTANAGGPYTGNEGSDISLSGGSANTTGSLTYLWSVSGGETGALCTFSDATLSDPTVNCNDEGSYTLTFNVTDTNGTYQDTATLTVDNVAPVIDVSSLSATPSVLNVCTVNFSGSFSDAGTLDTHSASINWGDSNTTTPTPSESAGSGTVSDSHTYGVGGSYTIALTVTDEAGETGETGLSDTQSVSFDNTPSVLYPMAPINVGNGSKTYKVGSAIPIKIQVVGCTTGIGTVTVDITPATTTISAKGKSNTLQAMRYDSSIPGYIYNWNTTGWVSGATYSIVVNGLPGGPYGPATVTLK
jgi:hypothetical protein